MLIFRIRYPNDINGDPTNIRGFISEGLNGPELEAVLNLYSDIPEVDAFAEILGQRALPIDHDARSNEELSNFRVRGKVLFLPDGRLTASLENQEPLKLSINLTALGGLVGGVLRVTVPAKRFVIDVSLQPIKQ